MRSLRIGSSPSLVADDEVAHVGRADDLGQPAALLAEQARAPAPGLPSPSRITPGRPMTRCTMSNWVVEAERRA